MNNSIIYILKTILYFVMIFSIYFIVRRKKKLNQKLKFSTKFFISLLIASYSILATAHPYVMDKAIYALKFSSDIYLSQVFNESIGLGLYEMFLHLFTYNPMILFSLTTFIFSYIILTAYDKCEEAKPITLLFLLISEFLFFSFYQIKQCLAVSLVTLGFVEYFNENKKIAIFYFIIAVLFHESSLIVFPILFLLKGTSSSIIRVIEYSLFAICILFFNEITSMLLKIVTTLIPALENQVSIYTNNGSIVTSNYFLTILKGLPFYIIVFFALLQRKRNYKTKKNYDKYLILSCFNCLTIILSGYMYWMFRFGIYFYFPTFILATYVYDGFYRLNDKKIFLFTTITIFVALAVKLWLQYYFQYGGI